MKKIIFLLLLCISLVGHSSIRKENSKPLENESINQVDNSIKVKELTLLVEFSQKNYPGVFTIESIQEAEVLDLSNSGIKVKDMPGIKYLKKLKVLNLDENKIKSLNVSYNKKLEKVICPLSLKKLIRKNNPNLSLISVGEDTVEVS
ncbi:MAG: hypothetical protein N4A44_03095 [Alphaproteobacteria bacterium]|jgi:hypothetical protein|nr:hypothetical protein [Alphaproteobacteria bacterium]